ncbi:MAG: hypothetical protein K2O00_04270 [Muribaculaceae bacterium]|nr:hypothetical protein [Muribaculaceae bacterium]
MFEPLKHKVMRRWITSLAILLLGTVALHLARPAATAATPSKKQYPVRGIDVSHYNKIKNFDALSKQIDFIFLRSSLGLKRDTTFNTLYKKAVKADIPVGAYHYFRFDVDGEAQANNFLRSIKGKKFEFPLVIDVEQHGNSTKVSTKTINARLKAMVNTVEKSGYKIIFYTNKHGYKTYIQPHYPDYPLWICSFTDPPINAKWVFWQYSHTGSLNGCKGKIDLDTFNGSKKQFKKMFPKQKRK